MPLFSARHLKESSVPQLVPFTDWVNLEKVTDPICCTRVTHVKQCDTCTEIKPKSLLAIHPYQKPSHNSAEMQTLLCRDQAKKKPGWQNPELQQHIRIWRERNYSSQSSYLLHIWQKSSLKQTNKQLFEEILILAVTLIRALTGFKPDAVEGSLGSDQV